MKDRLRSGPDDWSSGKYERWLSGVIPDRSGLAMITDRVQVQAWKVGEVILKGSKSLISPEIESPAVKYGGLGMSRVV
ncbi:hypothetical protein PIB30_021650 [Stylosanthes scabra]|uniref:Uncharacterized protein n=1 Tax=Stylosanthes scabra TaxID=79078 RepID=A0ABU6Y9F3_9FABA|nr:hypothetical protein [Stylosanthes scabra]